MNRESFPNPIEDRWREAILAERKIGGVHEHLKKGLSYLNQPRENALVLGDASLVQSKYLLDEGFNKVIDIDSSPTIFDDTDINTTKLERVLSPFESYKPSEASFDFIYGKSIAFNPKHTIERVLSELNEALRGQGIFTAVFALEEDSFRNIHYSEQEIMDLYKKANFEILNSNVVGPKQAKGLVEPGTGHYIVLISKRQS